jgi:hypothetical protein
MPARASPPAAPSGLLAGTAGVTCQAAQMTCPEHEPQGADISAKGCMVTNALLACSVGCDLNNALKQDARAPRSIAQTLPSGSSRTMHLDVPGNEKVHTLSRIEGKTLRQWRRSFGWDVPKTARELRRVASEPVAAPDALSG